MRLGLAQFLRLSAAPLSKASLHLLNATPELITATQHSLDLQRRRTHTEFGFELLLELCFLLRLKLHR